MDISIVAALILLMLQESFCNNFMNSTFDIDLPSGDLIIYTTGGPVPDYLLNSPYKIVPLSNRSFARRADEPRTTADFSSKESQNLTIVEDFARDTSIGYRPQTINRKLSKQRKPKNRNRFGVRNIERYNQQVESSDGVVAVPISLEQKGQGTSPTREGNLAIPDQSKVPVYNNNAKKLTTTPSYQYRDRNAVNPEQSNGPVYINSANKLTPVPSNQYRDRNVINSDQSKGLVYIQDANKLTNAPSNIYRDRNVVNQDKSNGLAYINNVSKLATVPSFLLPSENFPTPLAYSTLPTVFSINPSFAVPKKSTPSTKLNKFPRPTAKGYETAAYDLGPLYKPYSFGYDVFDGYGTKQYRQESATGDGVVRGNYGYKDFQGIYRQVEYTADENGFRAVLKSNEPGLANVDTADVSVSVEPPLVWPPSDN